MSDIKAKNFVNDLLTGYPDVDNLVRYSFSDSFIQNISTLDSGKLSSILAALSRFLHHVQYFGNQLQAESVKRRRIFEGQKYLTISKLDKITDRTPTNVMMARAFDANPKLVALENEMIEAEEMAKYYERMPDRLTEHIQIIKYELNRRENFKYHG